jgi:pyruvate,water dikinase
MDDREQYVRWLENLNSGDVALVGGKNASLGEMIASLRKEDIAVPDGFATTAESCWKTSEKVTNPWRKPDRPFAA